MTLIAADSFDYWTENSLPGPFSSYYTDSAGESTHPEFVISTDYGRDHSSGLRLITADYHEGSRGRLYECVNFLDGCIVGFAFYMPTTGPSYGSTYQHRIGPVPIATFYDGVQPQVTIGIDSAMCIRVYRGGVGSLGGGPVLVSSIAPLHENVWHYIEIDLAISNVAGSVAIYLDGKQIISQTSLDTQYTTNQYFTSFALGGWDTFGLYSGYYYRFDDFYILDHNGTNNKTPLGDVQVVAVLPIGEGNKTEWSPSSGTLHYSTVDDTVPPFSNDYVTANTVGQIDTYRYGTITISSGTIHALVMNPWASKTDTTIIAIGGVATNGASYQVASPAYLSISEQYVRSIFETNTIEAGRFTLSQLSNYYFGIKRLV